MPRNPLHDALLTHQADAAPFLTEPGGRTLTYGDLRAQVTQVAGALIAMGVAPGDRVLCQTAKSPATLIAQLATATAGAVFVPLDPGYTPVELDYFLGDADPALMILDATTQAARPVAVARGVPVTQVAALLAPGTAPRAAPVARAADDLAAILCTSGTTGRSKGAMLTHDNLVSNALALRDCWHWDAADVLLHALPVVHPT